MVKKEKFFPFVTSAPKMLREKLFRPNENFIHLTEKYFPSWSLNLKNTVTNRVIEQQIKEKSWHEISS